MRCPTCDGLVTVKQRYVTRTHACGDCRAGNVIGREQFYDFWLDQFTPDEIKDMANAIDAILGLRVG